MLSDEENLSEKRYLTLLLRLLVDKNGTPVHGEVLDVMTGMQRRFVGWPDLLRIVRDLSTGPQTEVTISYSLVDLPDLQRESGESGPHEILVRITMPDG